MESKQWTTIDKSEWQRGPWDSEPDKAQWTDEATGLPCLIVRNHGGALCGYVGVTDGHPLFGATGEYSCTLRPRCEEGAENGFCDHTPDSYVRVHGGITFTGFCSPGEDESRGICHVPAPSEPDHVFWLGFDCSHYLDYSPGHDATSRRHGLGAMRDGVYRTLSYVRSECARLASQLAAMHHPPATPPAASGGKGE